MNCRCLLIPAHLLPSAGFNRRDASPSLSRASSQSWIVIWLRQGRVGLFWLALCASSHCSADARLERREQQ